MVTKAYSGVALQDSRLFRQASYVDGAWIESTANGVIDVDNPAEVKVAKDFNSFGEALIGKLIAGYLQKEVPGYEPFTPSDPEHLRSVIEPGDVLLVEGNSRISGIIKYLTQSTWSHAALYVGPIDGATEDDGEPHAGRITPALCVEQRQEGGRGGRGGAVRSRGDREAALGIPVAGVERMLAPSERVATDERGADPRHREGARARRHAVAWRRRRRRRRGRARPAHARSRPHRCGGGIAAADARRRRHGADRLVRLP